MMIQPIFSFIFSVARRVGLPVLLVASSSLTLYSTPTDSSSVPAVFRQIIPEISYEQTEIRVIIRNLSQLTKANIQLNMQVTGKTSLRLYQQPLLVAIETLVRQYDLTMTWKGDLLFLDPKPRVEPVQIPVEPVIRISGNLLSIETDPMPTAQFIRRFIEVTGRNIIPDQSLPPVVSGVIRDMPFSEAVRLFFLTNQIKSTEKDRVFYLEPLAGGTTGTPIRRFSGTQLQVKDSLINLDVRQGSVDQLIKDAASQLGKSVVYYSDVQGSISASVSRLDFDQFLSFVLKNTQQTWKKEQGIYFIGDKTNRALISTQLLLLKNRKVEKLPEILPAEFTKSVTIKEIKEQNGILVTGNQNDIDDIRTFLQSIDYSTPQVLIEALVVDFSTSDGVATGVTAGRGDTSSSSVSQYLPGLDFKLNSKGVSKLADGLGMTRIGRLPDDFYMRIQALETAGLAKVRSRPMLSTLNGHKASLLVGTTQWYILKSTTPIRDNQGAIITESQQFKELSANIKLDITPWVSTSGEVTVEIKPVFESPIGQFSPDVPPTISKREFESTIRLSDGETIVLGGLVEESETENVQGIPYLSQIPWLGRFFSNTTKIKRKSELIIYVTPRVFLGEGTRQEGR